MLWLRAVALSLFLLAGCVSRPPQHHRPFNLSTDSFSFSNQLYWVYEVDPETGRQTHKKADSPPDYAHHCFVVARAARQFFDNAEFRPDLAQASATEYQKIIKRIVSRNPRKHYPSKVIVPGFQNLKAFSAQYEDLLKAECGGAWQSYLQRGNWRMILPFSRRHQSRMSEQLRASLRNNCPSVTHVLRFPELSINHAILVFSVATNDFGYQFQAYDPNHPDAPIELQFNSRSRKFTFPPTFYFKGGEVNVYEHYRSPFY